MTKSASSSLTKQKAVFTGVYVHKRDLVYIKGIIKTLDEDEVNHAIMLRWFQGTWGQYMIPNAVVSHCVINESDRKVLALGPDGIVHIATPKGFEWEKIDPSEEGPNSLRQMTEIRPIDGVVYAAGMSRMVYKRVTPNVWKRFDSGMRDNKDDLIIGGFKSIDGFSENSIYAVGFKGEIWNFNGIKWIQIESPTNVKLEKVRCVAPDKVYACGARGTIIQGIENRWTIVPNEATNNTFWGMEYFQGKLYLSTSKNIYVYDGNKIDKLDPGLSGEITTSYLHANDGVLWSVGAKNIIVYDGTKWEEITL